MKTLRLTVDPNQINTSVAQEALGRAAEILRQGGLVALPTETVYGLGANALDPQAVARIFAAKERPSWDPVIVHVAGEVDANAMLAPLVQEIPEAARKLMHAFWPGPLTLLLPRTSAVPDAVTAGRPLVGVRMPAHPVAFELIRRAGVPVAAPSANLFSRISPTTAEHVLADLDGRIDAVLDAGATRHGVESTVIDPCQNPMVIYRPGAVTAEQIESVAGPVTIYQSGASPQSEPRESLPSPGVGIRHYAPRARVLLLHAPLDDLKSCLLSAIEEHPAERIGVLLPSEVEPFAHGRAQVFPWGRWSAPEELASRLYAGLRALDAEDCDLILVPLPPNTGIGAAIRDRLQKAAWNDFKER